MSYILHIASAVPKFEISSQSFVKFYSKALQSVNKNGVEKKIRFLSDRTKIERRYSCIPDFNGNQGELYFDGNYNQPVEQRIKVYKQKVMPLAIKAIDKLLSDMQVSPNQITHLITVSCTGVFAPGLEFLVAKHYNMQETEKLGLNFLGCYAAIKALKHADFIARANPNACVLICCVELCSLHFESSDIDEDIVANLLFADGAAATLVCGDSNSLGNDKIVFSLDSIGSACIPNTFDLMTWNISSSAFKMFLSKQIVDAIKNNIQVAVDDFLKEVITDTDYWAIHPGGARILEAVKESLNLSDKNIQDSSEVLNQYGNMSSPTILFILEKIFNRIIHNNREKESIFTCAFGPGLSIEMIYLSSVNTAVGKKNGVAKKSRLLQSYNIL